MVGRFADYLEEKRASLNRERERQSMERSGMSIAELDAKMARQPRWVRMATWLPPVVFGPVASFMVWMEFHKNPVG